ncbi:hypothetical protein NC651_033890 [Populus alba x Populus x berolinensis]|nr:hypothetical protein NC651_033890 [Populus alba x Populus x berolinensis]
MQNTTLFVIPSSIFWAPARSLSAVVAKLYRFVTKNVSCRVGELVNSSDLCKGNRLGTQLCAVLPLGKKEEVF